MALSQAFSACGGDRGWQCLISPERDLTPAGARPQCVHNNGRRLQSLDLSPAPEPILLECASTALPTDFPSGKSVAAEPSRRGRQA